MAPSSSSNPPPPPPDPPEPTKDPFKVLNIEEKGPNGAVNNYSYMRDEFRADPETGDLICKTCKPEFRVLWATMNPEEGKQRQINKGNLKTHINSNKVHSDCKAAAASREKGALFKYLKVASKPVHQQQQQQQQGGGGDGGGDGDGDDDEEEEEEEDQQQQQQPPPAAATASTATISSTGNPSLEALQGYLAERHRCLGYRPPELGGSKAYLLDFPLAYFYHNSTSLKIRLNHRIEIGTKGFFAKKHGSFRGCILAVSRKEETCEACWALKDDDDLNKALA